MVNLSEPFTFENSSNPWLMDRKDNSNVLEIDGKKLTAAYLWTLNAEERKSIVDSVFRHYRENGFPKIVFSDSQLKNEFGKLKKFDSKKVLTKDGFVSNSGNLCIDLCKYFSQEFFYSAKGGNGTRSVREVFEDDGLLMRVLKNRMGWNMTKEDGVERPYLFPVSDKQLLNGIRNSGLGYGVSNFRPSVAKWAYEHAADIVCRNDSKTRKIKIFDYSAGWCARAMAALSLGFDYDATDPLTAKCVEKCVNAFETDQQSCCIYDKCSEDSFFRDSFFRNKYDVIGSCPPYFDLEIYDENDNKQSIKSCDGYSNWLEKYWRGTVENCKLMLKDGGVFFLVMKEELNGKPILSDMTRILESVGFTLKESFYYKTNTNHLSGKTRTGYTSKTNESVAFFIKL